MPDNLTNRGGSDRKRIDVNEDYELRDWSEKFGVSKDQLKEAVQAVGDQADKVQEYLRGRGDSQRRPAGSERSSSGREER